MSTDTLAPTRLKVSWLATLAVALVLFAVVGVYSLRISHETLSYDQERAAARYAKLQKLRDEDAKTLGTADWVDQGKGVVRIPIDEAMTQEVAALQGKPVQMGAAVAAPAAAATPNVAPTNTIPATHAPPAGTSGSSATNAPSSGAAGPAAVTNAPPTAAPNPPPH